MVGVCPIQKGGDRNIKKRKENFFEKEKKKKKKKTISLG